MARRLLNCPPNNTQRSAVNAIIARQESLVAQLRGMQEEDEMEHKRLAANAAVLQRSAVSTDEFRDIGTQICNQLSSALIKLDQLLLSTEADRALLSSLLPSTKTHVTNWTAIRHAVAALLSTVEEPMREIEEFGVSIAEELQNTEMLKDQMSHTTATLSEMIQCGLQRVKSAKEGILHPLRRLPDEIMLQIFGECIEEERERLREMLPITKNPSLPSTLAAVCKRWRRIVLHTPRFWTYICWPPSSWERSRLEGWVETVSLAKGSSLEMIISAQSCTPPGYYYLDITTVTALWPYTHPFPSPEHLWIGHFDPEPPHPYVIPATLVSSTTRLTCINCIPIFRRGNRSIKAVSIKGAQSDIFFELMTQRLLQLQKLDMTQVRPGPLITTFNRELTHNFLCHLAIHASALSMINSYLMRGLRLPALRRFAIEDVEDDGCSASNYTSISSQFKPTITALEISGISHRNSVFSWVEALLPLEELVTHGEEATLVVLSFLNQTPDSETDFRGANQLPREGLASLVIYIHEGTSILQQLEGIIRNPDPGSRPVNIIFEGCPNILPSIRAKISRDPENEPS